MRLVCCALLRRWSGNVLSKSEPLSWEPVSGSDLLSELIRSGAIRGVLSEQKRQENERQFGRKAKTWHRKFGR
jgi:hypothetical protein